MEDSVADRAPESTDGSDFPYLLIEKSVDFSSVLMMTKTVKRPSDDKASSNRCDIVVVRA